MKRESILPGSTAHWLELRQQDITSTEVSALFGCNPYMTAFELWHRKRGVLEGDFRGSERMEWGLRLERIIAETLCEKEQWSAPSKMDSYGRLPEHRVGSSFDYIAEPDPYGNPCLIECKNVDGFVYSKDWGEDQAPAHIEMQVQHQMLVSGYKVCHIAALVGGNQLVHLVRHADDEVHQQILDRTAEFWASEVPPEPDLDRDTEVIGRLCSFAQPGKVVECDGGQLSELVQAYQGHQQIAKNAKKLADQCKAQILMSIGDAEKVKGPDWTISVGLVGPAEVRFTRRGYRNFRVSTRKEKQ